MLELQEKLQTEWNDFAEVLNPKGLGFQFRSLINLDRSFLCFLSITVGECRYDVSNLRFTTKFEWACAVIFTVMEQMASKHSGLKSRQNAGAQNNMQGYISIGKKTRGKIRPGLDFRKTRYWLWGILDHSKYRQIRKFQDLGNFGTIRNFSIWRDFLRLRYGLESWGVPKFREYLKILRITDFSKFRVRRNFWRDRGSHFL